MSKPCIPMSIHSFESIQIQTITPMNENVNKDSNSQDTKNEKTVLETINFLIKKMSFIEEKIKIYNLERKEFLNAKETSLYFNTSVNHLYDLARKKLVPFYKPNKKTIYFKVDDIEEWIRNSRVNSKDDLEKMVSDTLCLVRDDL